jgi:hypothetical protein
MREHIVTQPETGAQTTVAARAASREQTAKFLAFVVSIQKELPGWRPSSWTADDEKKAFKCTS